LSCQAFGIPTCYLLHDKAFPYAGSLYHGIWIHWFVS
jgi:hypothetical protein